MALFGSFHGLVVIEFGTGGHFLFKLFSHQERKLQSLGGVEARVAEGVVAEFIAVTQTVNDCRDPKDNKFLDLALSTQAICIVSGDKDLQVLNPYHGIDICSPADFLTRYSR